MERTKEHVQFLDHLRGLAILGVFAYHSLGAAYGINQLPWGPWFRSLAVPPSFFVFLPVAFGWAGVAVFFVVSGFCIHLSHLRSSAGDWRGFYVRRFFRIYPPYFLAVLFFGVVFPATRLPILAGHGRGQMASHLLLFNNLTAEADLGVNPSFWSIAVEAQLYLIYPLLLGLVRRIGWRWALGALGTLEVSMRGYAGVAGAWGHAVPRWFDGSPFFYWGSWATGAALADAFAGRRPLPFVSWSASVFFALAIGTFFVRPLAPFSFGCFAVWTAILIARWLECPQAVSFRGPAGAHLRALGVCSYSLYLFHQPLLGELTHGTRKLGAFLQRPPLLWLVCLGGYPLFFGLSWWCYRQCEVRSIAVGKLFLRATPRRAD